MPFLLLQGLGDCWLRGFVHFTAVLWEREVVLREAGQLILEVCHPPLTTNFSVCNCISAQIYAFYSRKHINMFWFVLLEALRCRTLREPSIVTRHGSLKRGDCWWLMHYCRQSSPIATPHKKQRSKQEGGARGRGSALASLAYFCAWGDPDCPLSKTLCLVLTVATAWIDQRLSRCLRSDVRMSWDCACH